MKGLLVAVGVLAVLQFSLQAAGVSTPDTALPTFPLWTPANVITVLSVAFSFGAQWQTTRVQGKILKEFERWRQESVDPALTDLAVIKYKLEMGTQRGGRSGR